MNLDEATAWLRGERSNANYIRGHGDNIAQQESLLAVADAASTQQAYYVVKANREGLLNAKPRYSDWRTTMSEQLYRMIRNDWTAERRGVVEVSGLFTPIEIDDSKMIPYLKKAVSILDATQIQAKTMDDVKAAQYLVSDVLRQGIIAALGLEDDGE